MEATKLSKKSFGFSAVIAGQKASSVNADPAIIVNSTEGKFTITAPVAKALDIAPGDYAQFITNVTDIENAIAARDEMLVAFCEENGLDIETVEARNLIIKEFGSWGIAKGHQLFDSKGNSLKATERFTEADKKRFIAEHGAEFVAQNAEAMRTALKMEDATEEELLAALTPEMIPSPETDKYQGSKTSNTSKLTGVGVQVSFTDSNIWLTLKSDLSNPKAINRTYAIDINNPQFVELSNGKEAVKVKFFELGEMSDSEPIDRNKAKKAE